MVCGFLDVSDVSAVFLACFIVEDLVVYDVSASLEAGHDTSVGRDAVAVFLCLKGLDSDAVGIAVVGDHEVLVAAAGADSEASCVVCVERADRFHSDVELSGHGGLEMFLAGGSRRGGEVGLASLGGMDALLVLCEVALDGLITGWEILGSIGVGESWPGGEVAGFDGGKPGGFDWEACGGVEVAYEGTNAGEVVGVESIWGCRRSGMD